jgi:hypothetical protein
MPVKTYIDLARPTARSRRGTGGRVRYSPPAGRRLLGRTGRRAAGGRPTRRRESRRRELAAVELSQDARRDCARRSPARGGCGQWTRRCGCLLAALRQNCRCQLVLVEPGADDGRGLTVEDDHDDPALPAALVATPLQHDAGPAPRSPRRVGDPAVPSRGLPGSRVAARPRVRGPLSRPRCRSPCRIRPLRAGLRSHRPPLQHAASRTSVRDLYFERVTQTQRLMRPTARC